MANETYPPRSRKQISYNSLNTVEQPNATFFYAELEKTLNDLEKDEEREISYFNNYCTFASKSFFRSIEYLIKKGFIPSGELQNKTNNFFLNSNDQTNKSFFALNFMGPSFNYNGLSCTRDCKFDVTFERADSQDITEYIETLSKKRINFYLHTFFEKITMLNISDGKITRV